MANASLLATSAILPRKKEGGMRPNVQMEPSLNVSLWALSREKVSTEPKWKLEPLPLAPRGPRGHGTKT